jgi:hypothetical protein
MAAATMALAIGGCGGSGKSYDIGPIFPLSNDKCARYHGDEKGSGPTASCMVDKSNCEQAASDWHDSMQSSGVNDAIDFTCD